MSAELVYKALEIVDPEFNKQSKGNKSKKLKRPHNLLPDNQKTKKITRKGQKAQKVGLLSRTKKLTISDAKKSLRTNDEIRRDNLKKIQQIREACKIELDERITEQIIERGVTRRPVKAKPKFKEAQKTAFTEEDFKKFEAEYFG